MPQTAYIALGSNVGDRARNLAGALDLLARLPGITVVRVASAIQTDPVDCPPGAAAFLNSAAELRVEIGARELFEQLMSIEKQMGRRRTVQNAPRVIDLDLLLFGHETVDDVHLTIPHPRLHERAFVLVPLAEIAPDVIHPVLKKSISVLRDALAC